MPILRKQSVLVTIRPNYPKPSLAVKVMRAVLPPIARALRPLFSFTYDVFFGWLDRRTGQKNEAEFAQEISPLLLRFLRGRGEFMVEAGSECSPEHFVDCSLLVRSITGTYVERLATR